MLTPLLASPLFVDLAPPSRFDTVEVRAVYRGGEGAVPRLAALASSDEHGFALGGAPDLSAAFGGAPPALPTGSGAALARSREVAASLRGSLRLLVPVSDGPLSFTFTVQDMNRGLGADPATLAVYRYGRGAPDAVSVLADDGDAKDDQRSSVLRTVSVSLTDPAPGMYEVVLSAPGDVFTRKITTRAPSFVFAGRLWLGDTVGYSDDIRPTALWVGGGTVSLKPMGAAVPQGASVAGASFTLEEPQSAARRPLASRATPTAVTLSKNDVVVATDGVIALSRDDFFQPFPAGPSAPPVPEDLGGGRHAAAASFAVADLATTAAGAHRFALVMPDGWDAAAAPVEIESLSFVMRRAPAAGLAAVRDVFRRVAGPRAADARVLRYGAVFDENPE